MARSVWCSQFSTGISCSPTPTTAILPEPDVAYRRSGDVCKLLIHLLSTYRYEGDEISVPLAKKEAKILHEKISGKAYNDVELIRIFSAKI
ncbi:hypothetical protein L3X38_015900 [Prunus dulcis]|uniref:Uncharacterized protein n=1 Tax=Prunus dulcis TaxID=3755 RepID=A0AAD4W704_PRUDU|nr:hypothetical protein L3X38_015900 [Prunus dulcis]